MRRSSVKGLTLSEALVATSLTLILGIVMMKLLSSGLGAHSKGSQSRDAQAGVRNVISLVVAELRSSAPLPLSDPSPVTPVFWPGVWGASQELTQLPNYPRVTEAHSNGRDQSDSATNRLVYVRAREDNAPAGQGPLAAYVLVELVVPVDRPSVIERRIHTLNDINSPLLARNVDGANGDRTRGWLLDMGILDGATPAGGSEVVYDAGKDARVSFKVSHLTFNPSADPGRTRYPQLFEPGVFRLEVAIAVKAESANATTSPWPQTDEWSTIRQEATEIRIPSVRQN